MRFVWQKKLPGEFDHEAVWLVLALGAFVAARLLPPDGVGVGVCWFRALTGTPCPSCGGTRAFIAMAHGRWGDGFAWNPLAGVLFVGLAGYVLYAGWTLLFRRPRLRIEFARSGRTERFVVIAILALAVMADWAYVIGRFAHG